MTIDFEVTDNQPGVSATCFLDEATAADDYEGYPCEGPQVLRGLAPGRHVFMIIAFDFKENLAAEEIVFTVE